MVPISIVILVVGITVISMYIITEQTCDSSINKEVDETKKGEQKLSELFKDMFNDPSPWMR